jgi:lysophospholipase L1-like esterase
MLAGVSLVFTFLVLEVAARAVLRFGNDDERFLRYASARQILKDPERLAHYFEMRYEPHRYLGYAPTPGFAHGSLTHNSQGYKDVEIPTPKPAGEFRIVCVGGSTTYTTAVGDTKGSYPKCLEEELHKRGHQEVRVINAGAEGWTSYETLINIAFRVSELDADLVMLLCGVNDTYARLVWPPEAFREDNSGYRAPPGDRVIMPGLLEYSTLARVVLVKCGWLTPHFQQRTFGQDNSTHFYATEWTRQQITGVYPSGIFKEVGIETMFEKNSSAYFIRNLEHTLAMLQFRGVGAVVATVPYFADEGASTALHRVWGHPAFMDALEDSYGAMEAVAASTGAAFFDLAERFPGEEALFVDGIHLNEAGVKIKAQLFAEFLLEEGVL